MITLTTHWICKFFSSQSGNVGNIYTSKFYQNKRTFVFCWKNESSLIYQINGAIFIFFWLVCFILCLTVKQVSAFVAPLISAFLFTPESCVFCFSYVFSCHVTTHRGVACIKSTQTKETIT